MRKIFIFTSITFLTQFSTADTIHRVEECYTKTAQIARNTTLNIMAADTTEIEAARRFIKCQQAKEGTLLKNESSMTSANIIVELGEALKQDIHTFAAKFAKLVR